MRRYTAEALATFALVFAGTGAVVSNELSGGALGHVGIALTFGLVVLAMIYAVGDISGAHLNPAVTFGFWLAGRLPGREVAPFVLAQVLGAVAASLTLAAVLPDAGTLGQTTPAFGVPAAFVFEVVLTAFLMFVILGVSVGAKEKGITAGLAIGSTVALAALFGGPISGASMNPARSLGPALAALDLSGLWIYLIAPPLGSVAAVAGCRAIRGPECCSPPTLSEAGN